AYARAPRCPERAAKASGAGTRQGEVVGGLPPVVGVVDVEMEVGHGEGAVEVLELLEGAVETRLVEQMRHRDVRVVGVLQVEGEWSASAVMRELLGLGDALDQVHEDHRRDRTEGA